jgi:hypothetical protein
LDTIQLEDRYLRAGADYLRSLQRLGLDPEGLFWAHDAAVGAHVLVLVTSFYDHAGPLALSRTLFEAYEQAATPKEIEPFIIRLHSPDHTVIRSLVRVGIIHDPEDEDAPRPTFDVFYNGGGMTFKKPWIYKWGTPRKRSPAELSRRWNRFHRNVQRLAA